MGVIAPDTCSGHISDAARPFRKLVPKPELASIAGGEDHGLCTGVVLTDARPSLKHENGPATAATSTVSASTPWQHEPAAALGMYTAAVPQVDLPTRKRKRQDASRVHESIKPRRAGEATKNQRAAPLVNGKRSCTVTQHAGQGPDGPKVVFSIPPTSTRLAPTASTSEPLSDLERSQSSYSVKFPNEDGCGALAGLSQGGIICENSVYRMDINSNLFRPINSSVARYPTRTTTPRVQLPSRTSLQSNYPGTTLVQTSEHSTQANLDITNTFIRQDPDPDICCMPGNFRSISHLTPQDLLQEAVTPKTAFSTQLPPEGLEVSVSPPTISPLWSQALSNSPYLRRNNLQFGQYELCPYCPQFWLAHSECILMTRIGTQDCKWNDLLHNSFQKLKDHIQGHWVGSGIPCLVCQNYFFQHHWTLQHLSNNISQDLRSGQIKIDLEQQVLALRDHVRENHMG